MGTILASAIINKAATVLYDVNGVEWSRVEMLAWLNDAQRQVALINPTALQATAAMPMVAGTRQSIPANGWLLLDVYRNMGPAGTVPGRGLRLVEKKTLDQFNPNWHYAPAAAVVQEFIFDPKDQTKFWVNPPSDGTGYVEVNYAQRPTDMATETTAISVDDVFEPLLLDYALYRACSKDVDYAPGVAKADAHWAAFKAAFDAKSASEAGYDPNLKLKRPAPQGAPA